MCDNDIESKVIIMSASNEFEYAREAIKYGVSQYLCKAIDVKELVEALEQAAKGLKRTEDIDDYSREKFFLDLVMGTCNRNTIQKRLEKLSIYISAPNILFEIFEDTYYKTLKEIFNKLKTAGSEVVFMTPNMMNINISCHINNEIVKKIA